MFFNGPSDCSKNPSAQGCTRCLELIPSALSTFNFPSALCTIEFTVNAYVKFFEFNFKMKHLEI